VRYREFLDRLSGCSRDHAPRSCLFTAFILYSIIFQPPIALIFHSLPSMNANTTFYFKFHLITFEIHKMSFVAICFGITRPLSGYYKLEELTTLHGLTRQYYHTVSARRHIREMYSSHFPHAIFMYGVHTVFLVPGFFRSGVCPLYFTFYFYCNVCLVRNFSLSYKL
jgi:hypothetical protein